MATKKQKRQRGIEKHHSFMDAYRRSGLEELRKARAARFKEKLQEWQDQHDKKHNWKNRPKECPHCEIIRKAASQSAPPADVGSLTTS